MLSLIPSSLGVNFCKNKQDVCEICFCAKQSPGKSFVSHNKAESVFDLIHCDIGVHIEFLLLVVHIIF